MLDMANVLTVSEVAKRKGTTRQAVYAAIVSGALKATTMKVDVTGITQAQADKWQPNPRCMRAGRPRRTLCEGCRAEVTSADRQAGECTQCGKGIR